MNLTPVFNDVLRTHDSLPVQPYVHRLENLEQFLKEAYQLQRHITDLHIYLRSIRQSYLSAAQPPRRKQLARHNSTTSLSSSTASLHEKDASNANTKYLTDVQRNEIDANAKQLLREFNNTINQLSGAELARQTAESTIALKKRAKKGLGALGRWAAGGGIATDNKSPEEELEDAAANTIKVHREAVIWYLQRQLETCSSFQTSMMEIRLTRELEKNKSVLYKAQASQLAHGGNGGGGGGGMRDWNQHATKEPSAGFAPQAYMSPQSDITDSEKQEGGMDRLLDAEQLQLFQQEENDMLKHYNDTLDQVRSAEKSILEIQELHTTLHTNLNIQAEHIQQLVQDSFDTEDNVGSGNKELKKATERSSYARMVFWSTSAFCASMILLDFIWG